MKHKKLLFVALLLVSMLFSLSSCGWVTITDGPPAETPGSEQDPPAVSSAPVDPPAPISVNPLMEAELHTADVMNGFGTEKIGEWGYIEISKSDMASVTGEQLTEFCQNKCDGSGLNWVGIVFDDGSGLHITPGTWFVQIDYGTIDIETATFSDKVGAVIPETWSDGNTPTGYKYVSFEELYEIQATVENLLNNQYGGFYSCTVDFMEDGPGYSVSLLTDNAADIETLEALVNGLDDSRIAEIHITAMQDGKITGTN